MIFMTTSNSITHKFNIGSQVEGYLICVLDDKAQLKEIMLKIDKKGSLISGFAETSSSLINLCLSNGIPLVAIIDKLQYHKFEPSGLTRNPAIPFAGSVSDYLASYLKNHFIKEISNG